MNAELNNPRLIYVPENPTTYAYNATTGEYLKTFPNGHVTCRELGIGKCYQIRDAFTVAGKRKTAFSKRHKVRVFLTSKML